MVDIKSLILSMSFADLFLKTASLITPASNVSDACAPLAISPAGNFSNILNTVLLKMP
jgi:hypothetical protein